MNNTIIVGLGNDIVSDDRIGLDIANEIVSYTGIDIADSQAIHMGLLSEIDGYQKMIIIDSIKTGKNPIGSLSKLTLADVEKRTGNYSTHQVSLYDLIHAGTAMGFSMPEEIIIYAIEIEDNLTISEKMTEALAGSYNSLLIEIKKDMDNGAKNGLSS